MLHLLTPNPEKAPNTKVKHCTRENSILPSSLITSIMNLKVNVLIMITITKCAAIQITWVSIIRDFTGLV